MTRTEVRRLITAQDAVWEGWWPILLGLDKSIAHRPAGGSFPSDLRDHEAHGRSRDLLAAPLRGQPRARWIAAGEDHGASRTAWR